MLRCAASFVIATYDKHASFLRISALCLRTFYQTVRILTGCKFINIEWLPTRVISNEPINIVFRRYVVMTQNHCRVLSSGLVPLIFLLFMGVAHAGNQVVLDADQQYQYAESCFSRGDYEAATAEFKRFVHFFPEDVLVEKALFAIAMSDYHRERFEEAIAGFTESEGRFPNTPLSIRAAFMISECYLRMKDTGNAIITLHNLLARTADTDVRDEAYDRMAWIYIERGEFEKARSVFQKISLKNQSRYAVDMLSSELEKDVLIPRKDPQVAGVLSILPGGGYLYCERYQDALVAFLLNGALILASWEAFDQGNPALGGVIAAVEFGFYAGNIYGGVASAHKYNDQKTRSFIESLKENARIGVSGVKGGLGLSVQIPF
jgi:TolA-binding protein